MVRVFRSRRREGEEREREGRRGEGEERGREGGREGGRETHSINILDAAHEEILVCIQLYCLFFYKVLWLNLALP